MTSFPHGHYNFQKRLATDKPNVSVTNDAIWAGDEKSQSKKKQKRKNRHQRL